MFFFYMWFFVLENLQRWEVEIFAVGPHPSDAFLRGHGANEILALL
jgi:hypothetical protein